MNIARLVATTTSRVAKAGRHRDTPLVLGASIAYGIAVFVAINLTRDSTNVAAIWPANGILLAALLLCPRSSSRSVLIAACFVANTTACLWNGDGFITGAAFATIGAAECLLAFRLLRRVCGRRVELTEVWTVVKFVAICIAAPVLPSLAGATYTSIYFGAPLLEAARTWYLSDTLGLLIITPAILLLTAKMPNSNKAPSGEDVMRHFMLLAAVCLVVFVQTTVPLLFLIVPVSVLIAFRLGARYAAVATLLLTFVSVTCTYQGWGPAAMIADPSTRVWVAQLFSLVNLLTSLAVAVEIAERDRLKTELRQASTLASQRRTQLDTALDSMSQGVCLFDRENRVVVRNSRFLTVYGLASDAVPPGMSMAELMQVCRSAGVFPDHENVEVKLNVDSDSDQQLVDGRHIRISQRVLSDGGVICTYTDFTAEKLAEVKLLHRTLHDILTGLPNRRLLVERVDHAMAGVRRGKQAAVMLLDIDYFKSINDNMGHAAGDQLLKTVADRLRASVRETDTVARLGGDEFAILLEEGEQGCDAATVARRILDAMKEPVFFESKLLRVGMSIGIAKPPGDGATTDDILKSADVALYKAKRNGRGDFAFFDAKEDAGACSARRLESEMRCAIEEEQFRLVYQPIFSGSSGEMTAVEALIRWDHPEFGTISPAEFIPIAERNGLILEIGDWVLARACKDAASLPQGIKVSVNLSRVQISDRGFVERTAQILAHADIPPSRLELEVTETAILDNEANAHRVLEELCALGVSVAIDDFGVGQSALSCLRDLPVGRIKIDRSFVNDLATDTRARSIFVAIASLAKSLGFTTTAEGIETDEQRTIASLAGCDHLQGYLMGRPMALADFSLDRMKPVQAEIAFDKTG